MKKVNPWLVSAICVPVLFMVILDTTVVDVIIPHMMAALSADYYDIQWVIISYMVSAAVVMPTFDYLSSRFEYKKLFIAGTLLFTLSSAFCGRAQSFYAMVTGRVLQGAGEGIVVPVVTSMIFTAFPPERRGLAMGLIGMGATMGPALGPTLGGYLTQHLSWRWAFFINVPIGLTISAISTLLLPEFRERKSKMNLDFIGFLLSAIFLSSLLIALSKGQEKQWFSSDFILYSFIVAGISLSLLILTETRKKRPLIELRVFKNRVFSITSVVRLIFGGVIYGSFFMIPIYCEKLRLFPTFTTGLLILPGALFNGIGTIASGRLTDRFGGKKILMTGIMGMAVALYSIHFLDLDTPKSTMVLKFIPFFLFVGFTFTPLNYMSLACLPKDLVDVGSYMIHVVRFIAGSVGTAVATNRFEYMMGRHFTDITSNLNWGNLVLRKSFGKLKAFLYSKSQTISLLEKKGLAALKGIVTLKSYVYSYQDCMMLFSSACILALLVATFIPEKGITGKTHISP